LKKLLLFLSFIIACCLNLPAFCQEYAYEHYGSKEGLAGNNVYHAIQDKAGFIWFATETGVSRFDGSSFLNFTTAEGLPDNEILRLFEDSKRRVWMLPFNDDICFYQHGRIHNTSNDPLLRSLKIHDRLLQVMEDSARNLYFIEANLISVLNNEGKVISIQTISSSLAFFFGGGLDNKNRVSVFLSDAIGTTGIYYLQIKNDSLHFILRDSTVKFRANKISYCFVSPQLVIYNIEKDKIPDHSFVFFDYINRHRDTIPLPKGYNNLTFFNDSILFMGTRHGVFEYNFLRKQYVNRELESESVSYSLKDMEGNTWFTTLGNGVFRLYSKGCTNYVYSANESLENSISSLFVNKNGVLAGNENGTVYHFVSGGNMIKKSVFPSSANKIIAIKAFRDDIYILNEASLFRTGKNNFDPKPVVHDQQMYSFKDVEFGSMDTFYFAAHDALIRTGKKQSFDILSQNRATSVCKTDSGLYVGTLAGLKFIDWENKVTDIGKIFSLLNRRITKILGVNGNIWVGTNDNGMICYDGKKIRKQLSEKNGLTGNLIRTAFADNNFLWVGTSRGLNKIDLRDTSFPITRQFTISDGLASNMINAVYYYGDSVYVGTPKGLSILNEKFLEKNSSCLLRLLDIKVSGQERAWHNASLLLKNRENNIRFGFVAISYKSAGNITYHYKLTGLDNKWNTTRQNFLSYPTLPSGKYTLELYAVNKFGVKSETVKIPFEVAKQLYEQFWFLLLCGLLFSIAIWAFFSWRIKKLRAVQAEKIKNAEKIAWLEQQALKAQMNPHFIFNCLNSIQQFVIEKDVAGANKFISGFAGLIRQTLDNSGKVNITVSEEENFLRSYLNLEQNRFENKFEYVIRISNSIRKEEDCLPPMLLQPYIENSIRHGIMHKQSGKGHIEISFEKEGGYMVCNITDNGAGREAAANYNKNRHYRYESKGMSLTGQRIQMMNQKNRPDILLYIEDIFDENKNPAGTKVMVKIPLQKID
jgi:sugar lactone lactonase YvrE